MSRTTLLIPLLLLIAGCADTTPLTVGPDHPAHPNAPVALLAAPSSTLAVTTAPTTSTASPGHSHDESVVYSCPHHPGVASDEPGKCPECGMSLVTKGGAP